MDINHEISLNPKASDKTHTIYGTVNPIIKGIFSYCPVDNEWKLRRKEINNSLTKSLVEGPYSEAFKSAGRELVQVFEANKDNLDVVYHCTFAALNIIQVTHFGIERPLPTNHRFFNTWMWLIHFLSLIFSNPLVALVFSLTHKLFDKYLITKANVLLEQVERSVRGHVKKVYTNLCADPRFLPLSAVIALRNKNRNLGALESKKELSELLLVGSHTAAAILIASFNVMATLPEIQEKVWKEQYEIFGTSNRDPNLEDLRKMIYLDKFLKEILRFFGPKLVSKVTSGEVKAGGVTIPDGTDIYFLLGKIRMDKKLWKDPQVFNPEHVFEDKPKFANAAFGVGVRSCPGIQYARQELKIIISIIVRKYKLYSRQRFEDFRLESHLLPEIVNLEPIQVEQRIS